MNFCSSVSFPKKELEEISFARQGGRHSPVPKVDTVDVVDRMDENHSRVNRLEWEPIMRNRVCTIFLSNFNSNSLEIIQVAKLP